LHWNMCQLLQNYRYSQYSNHLSQQMHVLLRSFFCYSEFQILKNACLHIKWIEKNWRYNNYNNVCQRLCNKRTYTKTLSATSTPPKDSGSVQVNKGKY
jgi:aminopeptidase-like protein